MSLKENIRYWVKNGPHPVSEGYGTVDWFIGMFLWWRIQYSNLILMGGFVFCLFAIQYLPEFYAVLVAYFVGDLVGFKTIKISPKYSVEKNY